MFEKFRFGSYRIDDSELANLKRNNNNSKSYAVAVEFLDSKAEEFYLDVSLSRGTCGEGLTLIAIFMTRIIRKIFIHHY